MRDAPIEARSRRIAMIASALWVGGLERFLISVASGLVDRGHTVRIFLVKEPGAWCDCARQGGLDIVTLGRPLPAGLWGSVGALARAPTLIGHLRRFRPQVILPEHRDAGEIRPRAND